MTQSDILRESVNQHIVKNNESKLQDCNILDISYQIHEEMKLLYPNYHFGVDVNFPITNLRDMVFSDVEVNDKSYFKPDGGLLWVLIKNKKYTYLFFVWAGLISYAQIYVGVHYPLDVLVGTLIGITLGYTFAKLYLKWNDKLTISSH